MKKMFWKTLLPALFLQSCGQKFYVKNDFTFWEKNFVLDENSLLKTNGIYVLDAIWSSKNGGEILPIKNNKIYQFYKTGQSNFWFGDGLKSNDDYVLFLEKQKIKSSNSQSTLFQGYYKINKNQIIIQNVNVPLKRFNYTYGFIEANKLIIVKEDVVEGNGKFEDKYFTNTYKETYTFKELKTMKEAIPNW